MLILVGVWINELSQPLHDAILNTSVVVFYLLTYFLTYDAPSQSVPLVTPAYKLAQIRCVIKVISRCAEAFESLANVRDISLDMPPPPPRSD